MLERINGFLWGVPVLGLILGTGLWLGLRTGFVQVRMLGQAMREFLRRMRDRDSGFRALCTALAATVGTGNIAGVAGAIAIGGPGAVFWMWVSGFLGMGVKYAEGVLAVRYREKDGRAGPMYIIRNALGGRWRWAAGIYALFGLLAAFGVGNATQVNAVMMALKGAGAGNGFAAWVGIGLAAIAVVMVSGGAKRLTRAAEAVVPVVSGAYMLLCVVALWLGRGAIPGALTAILRGAWDPEAVTGGMVGSAALALRIGVSRGTFTNEAGMGTAAIAHAQACVGHPAQQGLMGIMEVFLDTIVICTLTALAILVSGVSIPYGKDVGAVLTTRAFAAVYGDFASIALGVILSCFAFATVLGWGLYGARCAEYLFGSRSWKVFALAQTAMVIAGAVADTASVWALSETVNGLMAIPNLITLALLSNEVTRLTIEYRKSGRKAGGGTYANFHQCKPLRTLSYEKVPPSGCGSQERGQENLPSEHRPARSAHPRGLLRGHPQVR